MYDSVNDKVRVGNVKFDGVEMRNGGQEGFQSKATVNFINVIGSVASSSITGSSFANCRSWCVRIQNSQNISLISNILYKAVGVGIKIYTNIKSATVTSNLIVGISRNVTYLQKLTACVIYT